jgi:hypothetical protein
MRGNPSAMHLDDRCANRQSKSQPLVLGLDLLEYSVQRLSFQPTPLSMISIVIFPGPLLLLLQLVFNSAPLHQKPDAQQHFGQIERFKQEVKAPARRARYVTHH